VDILRRASIIQLAGMKVKPAELRSAINALKTCYSTSINNRIT